MQNTLLTEHLHIRLSWNGNLPISGAAYTKKT